MGNCIRKESSNQWGGDDWGSFNDDKITTKHHHQNCEDQKSSHDHFGERSDSTDQMKIKVSKKQLEQILKNADVQGMTMDQVFAQMTHAADSPEPHQRPWTPALQSIPE